VDDKWLAGWLVGLTDGEGYFVLRVFRWSKKGYAAKAKPFRRIEFMFGLSLRCDDWRTLQLAGQLLGNIGRATIGNTNGPWLKSGKRVPVDALRINDQEGLAKVVEFFRANPLRSKKARDFEVWAEAFDVFSKSVREKMEQSNGQRFRRIPEPLFAQMEQYAEKLRRVRLFKKPSNKERRSWASTGVRAQRKSNFELWVLENPARPCACGCGNLVEPRRVHYTSRKVLPQFLPGHYWKVPKNAKRKHKQA